MNAEPVQTTWKSYEVEILGMFREYPVPYILSFSCFSFFAADYVTADRKAEKGRIESDLNSDAEDQSPRRRPA